VRGCGFAGFGGFGQFVWILFYFLVILRLGFGLWDILRLGGGDGTGYFLEFFEGGDGALVVALGGGEIAAAEIEGVAGLGVLEEGDGEVVGVLESGEIGFGERAVPGDFEIEEMGFDGGEAVDAPHGIGGEAHGIVLGLILGLEGLDVAFEVGVVGGTILIVDDHGCTGEAVFAGVLGGDGFALWGGGSGGVAGGFGFADEGRVARE
jgi:hypothetical protein